MRSRRSLIVQGHPDNTAMHLCHAARTVVTMGMPAIVYRWFYAAHGVRALERNVLAFIGIAPVGRNFFGGVEKVTPSVRERWQADMHRLGRSGQ